MEILREKKRS